MSPEPTPHPLGDDISVGNIQSGQSAIAVGRGAHAEVHIYYGVPRPSDGRVYLAPPLPPHHVPRLSDIAVLRAALLDAHHEGPNTMALRGMGGVGKTILAIALCHDQKIIEYFTDGILWCTLGPNADLTSAQISWGYAFGEDLTKLVDAEARASRLRSVLFEKKCLLVIDDVWDSEHLLSMQVGGPLCRTIVTTRERKIAQKVGTAVNIDVFDPEQALQLIEKWRGEISANEKAIAGELARRLGYLPLALVLAGAQLQDGERWEDLLAVFRNHQSSDLTILDLDNPRLRDESLRITFNLSIERLSGALPTQFSMLGVFAAGREAPFSIEAVAFVWGTTIDAARKDVQRLVRSALVNKEEGEFFSLHLLLGDYANSLLDPSTGPELARRHSDYYLQRLQVGQHNWKEASAALLQIRHAWEHVEKNAPLSSVWHWVQLGVSFFERRGYWMDSIEWLKRATERARSDGGQNVEAWCQNHLGYIYRALGQSNVALSHYEQALSLNYALQDRLVEAQTLNNIGRIYDSQGRFDQAMRHFSRSLDHFVAMNDTSGQVTTLINLGSSLRQQGSFSEALAEYERALSLSRTTGNVAGEARSLLNCGSIYAKMDQHEQALEFYFQSLPLWVDKVGDVRGEGVALNRIGEAYCALHRFNHAVAYHQKSAEAFHGARDGAGEAGALYNLGLSLLATHQSELAREALQQALRLYDEIKDESGKARTISLLSP